MCEYRRCKDPECILGSRCNEKEQVVCWMAAVSHTSLIGKGKNNIPLS